MRNQHVWRASRVALFAVLLGSLSMWACQDPQPEAPKDASGDFALGVDGEFGVETFALGVPAASVLLPTKTNNIIYVNSNGCTNTLPPTQCQAGKCQVTGTNCGSESDCPPFVQLSVTNFPLGVGQGEIHCYVNGGATVYSSNPTSIPQAYVPAHPDMVQILGLGCTQGLYTIECVLADSNGVELTNPEARTTRAVQLLNDPFDLNSPLCANDGDCNDNNACSAELCVKGKCQYTALGNCCTDDLMCAAGESCLNPNTANSKCSACTIDGDCADSVSCTLDKCDLSGAKGKCTHDVPADTCCAGFAKCDDGKPCTNDSCDLLTNTCSHVQPEGACCADSECPSADPCKVGGCVALQCRYAANGNKDCCSATTNPSCDDKNICTIDSCDTGTIQPGGWTQCKHVLDPLNPTCCNDNVDCVDANGCTQDLCVNHQCQYPPVTECCASEADCNDGNTCTVDSCPKNPGESTGGCVHEKTAECCNIPQDCNDQKFCTADNCNLGTHQCTHLINDPFCCDVDSQCSDGKLCTADLCINHSCLYPKDGNKPNCCEDNNSGTCNDNLVCTIDTCKIQTGCGGVGPEGPDVTIAGPTTILSNTGNTWQAQSIVAVNTGVLTKLELYMNSNAVGAQVEMAVYADKTPDKGGTLVAPYTTTLLPDGAFGMQKITITPVSSTPITAGKTYFILFHGLNAAIQTQAYNATTMDVYAAGSSWTGGNNLAGPWTATNTDFRMSTYFAVPQTPCDPDNNQCLHVNSGDPNCCDTPTVCDDLDCNTLDVCSSNNQCIHKQNPYTCTSDLDCDDGKGCTLDKCDTTTGCGSCVHTPKTDCCDNAAQCDDKQVCTIDTCDVSINKCVHTANATCCTNDTDATVICDDKDSCTIDYCQSNQCHHTLPKGGCCQSNLDCFDGNKCTADLCDLAVSDPSGTAHLCKYEIQDPNCSECTLDSAIAGIDCNDNNLCTQDYCDSANHCHNQLKLNCCFDKFDCDDHNDCTVDVCTEQHSCLHQDQISGVQLCCKVESQDVDCAYLNTECQKGACVDAGNGNGSTKCVAQDQDICTVNIGYCQSFEAGTTLHGMGWNPMFADGSAPNNWTVEHSGNLGPDGYANFSWTPTKTNYGTCLQSPIIQAAGAKTITVQYDHEFIWNANSTQIVIIGSLDGANANWNNATMIDSATLSNNVGPETLDVKLPSSLTGSNGLRLAFCMQGTSTFDITSLSLDNICIVKGSKPAMVACPVNQVVPFQAKKTIPLKAKDPDLDAILSFQLMEGPGFISLSSAIYFWLDKSWNSTLTINPTSTNDIGTHTVKIKVSDGALYSICTFTVTVTYNGGYLVMRPPEVTSDMGDALATALKAAAPTKVVQHIDDIGLYPNLAQFEAVFLVLGVYPANHQLTEGESAAFQTYLSGGGRLYMEGSDTFAYDPPTSLHNSFKVIGATDVPEAIANELLGQSIYKDLFTLVGNPPAPVQYSFGFSFSDVYNNGNNTIAAKDVHRTQNLLKSNGVNFQPFVQVGHDDDAGFRTVASTVPFAGIMPGPVSADPPVAMVGRILNFFNNGFIDCAKDLDCNDSDDCTTDTCVKGECIYNQICTCQDKQQLACGDTIQVTTSLTVGTKAVKQYGCDTATFGGIENGYTFLSTTSRPATLTVTGSTNTAARAFVIRADETNTCLPLQCIAETGNGTKNFAAAANQTYYIMVDTPVGTATSLTLQVTCGDPEICNDNIDNNQNGLIDCNDLASCCGDAACGEVCDGVDNNCDGKIDEGCDKDGDGWCDAAMTVVGNPPVCSLGTGDCNDSAGTINPGAQDICGNLKDDNCNGQTDEENGSGCTNYWVDTDKDGFGGGNPQCLCLPSNTHFVTKGGDCDDANKKVNPSLIEVCGNNIDDNCDGSQNDQNAQGCTDFYLDLDGDGSGANTVGNTGKQCLCVAAGNYSAPAPGDCNDANKFVHPGATELCNNIDDNCNTLLDEGCDDDQDGYCDATMGYVSIGVTSSQCGQGPEGAIVAINCEAGRTITAIEFASFGNPTGVCGTYKAGTCVGGSTLQAVKNACLGKAACSVTVASSLLGDGCAGQPKTFDLQVTCMGSGGTPPGVCPNGPGDSNDNDPNINPNGQEICDNIDNNSDGFVDEGCDDDGDHFCDSSMVTIGAPLVCPAGAGDCNDTSAIINPGAQEDCSTTDDDDCDGNLNNQDSLNCTVFFSDGDNDGYGTKTFKCFCNAVGLFKAKKTADCQDNNSAINPGVSESCNGIDDDCDGVVDNGCDGDGDGYCASGKLITAGTVACPNGGGDCDDANFDVNPGKTEICGDGIDNNCNGSQNDAGALLCQTYYADVDLDGYGSASSKCQCAGAGNFTATVAGDCNDANAAINPAMQELCDGIDNNCMSGTDENCDKDQDGFCDASKTVVGTPAICTQGGGDCNDTNGSVHPNLSQEVCDNVDDDCDGVTDNGCDKDKDGYCDATYAVTTPTPPVCSQGVNDCDDYDNTVNPDAPEICGNSKDDNCNGNQNDEGATNCVNLFQDGDGDGYGLNASKCLCVAAGAFKAPTGDDCDDTNAAVHPGQQENCSTAFDDNCNLDTNDENAANCVVYALDNDVDGYGISALTKCYCVGANKYTANPASGTDCNDNNAQVNPGATEKCNDIDDNCKNGVDEGCNGDGDKFCNAAMTTVGFPNICAAGGGDCNDSNANINPGAAEKCDGLDNNCSATTDEGCDDDQDHYCDANMTTVGTPITCVLGGGDCDDTNKNINPGQTETCTTTWDDNCNGDNNDINATGCNPYGVDMDGDTYSDKNKPTTCYCVSTGVNTGTNAGDCDDLNNLVHPGLPEICDGRDNNCNGVVDEGCDDDGDHWCDSANTTVGKPPICTNGGGDCNDNLASINPGVNENCSTPVDDNCSGGNNDNGAIGCTTFFLDNDGDLYGVSVSQCTCVAAGKYVINTGTGGLLGDCDDTNVNVNPGKTEVCGDGVDNNCNGTQNDANATGCAAFYIDADKDGYGPSAGGSACQCFAQGTYVSSISGDCNDNNASVSPGQVEKCDNLDNNCATGTDEGCDDDNDHFCDANMILVGATGTVTICVNGGGDCDDTLATGVNIYPGRAEQCDNVDQNCNGVKDEGCDDDKDSFCDKTMVVVYAANTVCPLTTNAATLDCDDTNAVVNPNKVEICDGLDNNCNGLTDENCDKDADGYCDSALLTVGKPPVCVNGGGDCNDALSSVNPGKAELCNGVDDNCVGGVDEVCKDTDHDGYCIGAVVGTPVACPQGGNDCDDSNVNVHPAQPENCATQYDDNCDGVTNPTSNLTASTRFYTDVDLDGYGTGAGQLSCYQIGTFTSLVNTDCDDTKAAINPSALEICDGIDNDCKLGVDQGCDDDTDGYCDATMLITSTALCASSSKPGVGATKQGDDCVDTGTVNGVAAALLNPGKPEVCNNADDNCSGVIDEGCDDDKDSYCDSAMTVTVANPAVCPSSGLGAGTDCNDLDALVNPGKAENCATAYDDNCDGSLNAINANGCTLYYLDADGDGFGVTTSTQCQCIASVATPFYRATVGGDCNDASNAIFPGATEICDNKDNNCDAFLTIDEGCDVDKDGYCALGLTVTVNTVCPNQAVGIGTDCNDANKLINPAAIEVCDGQDNNCVSGTDEACNGDGDLYCSSAKVVVGTPAVCTGGGGDCNDANVNINPGKPEICNGLDDNCNGLTDDSPTNGTLFYYDGDQDGEPINSNKSLCATSGFWSYSVAVKGAPSVFDCDDNGLACGANCNHVLTENRCDGFDNNCNGSVDEGCNNDGDGYCTSALTTVKNSAGNWPAICTSGGGDCNDGNSSIRPNAVENCNNVDDNCNGQIDEQASAACANLFPNATGVCSAGSCVQAACKTGYVDSNVGIAGCECYAVDQWEPNDSCGGASTNLGTLYDGSNGGSGTLNSGTLLQVTGIVADTNDHDWFTFYGQDYGDGNGYCDHYNVRAVFTTAVSGVVFDIYRGGCPPSANPPAGVAAFTSAPAWPNPYGGSQPSSTPQWNQVCCGQQDFNWFTYFKDWRPAAGGTGHYEEYGECPCSAGDTFQQDAGWNTIMYIQYGGEWGPLGMRRGAWSGYSQIYDQGQAAGIWGGLTASTGANYIPGGWDYTKCVDDSAQYYVHVYRTSGIVCSQYRLEVSNGVYGATGGGGGWGQTIGKNW
jgi:hypothetical protein